METTTQLLDDGKKFLVGNYGRLPVAMVRGEGAFLWDSEGKKYIDLFAGFGGSILGHCHPALIKAATEQAAKLWHVGNTFYTEPQIKLAKWLNKTAFAGQAFFCHSGAEANEGACKLARLRGNKELGGKWKIISLNKSFHGRTLAMIAATGNPAYRAGFEPAVEGFSQVDGGDIEKLAAAVDEQTCAIIMEPIQGEGGINEYPAGYAQAVRKLCEEKKMSLIFDEVWTGGGRTGKWFGYQYFDGVVPDIMSLGKAIGGGLPVGAFWAKPEIAKWLVPGTHGCTLGANPICMSVAAAIFETIEKENLLAHVNKMGEHVVKRLKGESKLKGKIAQIRGKGLMLGIEMAEAPAAGLVERGLEKGVVMNLTAKNVVRIAPALTITQGELDDGLDRLIQAIA